MKYKAFFEKPYAANFAMREVHDDRLDQRLLKGQLRMSIKN